MIRKEHEVYKSRGRGNRTIGLVLAGFVLIVFAVTVVKLSTGQMTEAYDHVLRPGMVPEGSE